VVVGLKEGRVKVLLQFERVKTNELRGSTESHSLALYSCALSGQICETIVVARTSTRFTIAGGLGEQC
jgi:hypothetical protein